MSNIFPYHRKIQPFTNLNTFNSMNVEDNRYLYEGKDAFLRLPTSFCKSVQYEVLSFICVLDHKHSELGTGRGSYAVVLLVS